MKDQIILVLLVGSLLIAGCTEPVPIVKDPNILEDPELECGRIGGIWKEFSSGCVDSCFKERSEEPPICTTAMTFSCDCGPTACWNGETCEAN